MGKMATIDTETQNKNISINEIILKLTKKPMDIEDFESIGRYFNALKQANLIDLVGLGLDTCRCWVHVYFDSSRVRLVGFVWFTPNCNPWPWR